MKELLMAIWDAPASVILSYVLTIGGWILVIAIVLMLITAAVWAIKKHNFKKCGNSAIKW